MENLQILIKECRKRTGFSMQKIQDLTGIPKERLYKWEKGHKPFITTEVETAIQLFKNGTITNFINSDNKTSHIDKNLQITENQTKSLENDIVNCKQLKQKVDHLEALVNEKERMIQILLLMVGTPNKDNTTPAEIITKTNKV